MRQPTLEKRVATLEKQVSELLAAQTGKKRVKDWRRTFGAFTGDELMKEIFEEGRKIREADRKRARARSTKKPRARA
jgi:hypothetical protein